MNITRFTHSTRTAVLTQMNIGGNRKLALASFLVDFVACRVGKIGEKVRDFKTSREHFFRGFGNKSAGVAFSSVFRWCVDPTDANPFNLGAVGNSHADHFPCSFPKKHSFLTNNFENTLNS